jgi:hypothetical protein
MGVTNSMAGTLPNRSASLNPRLIALGGVVASVVAVSLLVARVLGEDRNDPAAWLAAWSQIELFPYGIWGLLVLIVCCFPDSRSKISRDPSAADAANGLPIHQDQERDGRASRGRVAPLGRSVGLALLGLVIGTGVASYWGWPYRGLPPLYHDEYSYLFQAQTFLAGRVAFAEPPAAAHFQQTHLLCGEGVYASRYFPGTGLWLAFFEALGISFASGWVAQGLFTTCFALAARRAGRLAPFFAIGLIGFSPGLLVFSQTLLSPHPTMVALAIGWWAMVEMMSTGRARWGLLAGLAIGWGFLCRPLTAVAIAGPWGLWAIGRAMALPKRGWFLALLLGFMPAVVGLGLHNRAIMGSIWVTPYGHYIEQYTPSHVYGFFNRTRGHQQPHPHRDIPYDEWSTELDLAGAFQTTAQRLGTAIAWMGGVFPVTMLAVVALASLRAKGDLVLLPILSVVALTAVYFPYFYTGVMGWSYLCEATPFFLFAASIGLDRIIAGCRVKGQWALGMMLGSLPLLMIGLSGCFMLPSAFSSTSEIIAPRILTGQRIQREEEITAGQPSLLLYDIDRATDLHSTWVHNRPTLDGPIVRAWCLDPTAVLEAFPDRRAWLFRNGRYQLLREPAPPASIP